MFFCDFCQGKGDKNVQETARVISNGKLIRDSGPDVGLLRGLFTGKAGQLAFTYV